MKTGLSHFFLWVLSRPFADRMCLLLTSKWEQDYRKFLFLALSRPFADRMCLLLTSKWKHDYRIFCFGLFSAFLVQNFTFPVSNLTRLWPHKSSTTVAQKKCCANHWIYPLKPRQDACRIFVCPLWAPFCSKFHLSSSKVNQVGNRNCVIRVGSSSRSLGVVPLPLQSYDSMFDFS